MSTRALIAKELKSGKYKTIYCHSDGYPKGVGKTLLTEYNTEEKLDALLDLGDLSIFGKQLAPDPTKPHEHLDWQRDVTLAYGRDIGEKGTEAREYTYRRLLKASDADYIYVLGEDGTWQFTNAKKEPTVWKNLAEELQGELQAGASQEENNETEDAETESFTQSM